MAGDWIKMRVDLADDPAVIGIAARLGLDEFSVVGRLQSLWSWADGQSRDGHARGVTAMWVNRKLQCDGFAEAMVGVGWLVVDGEGITFPNFDNHNGETAKTRALGKNRKQKQRANVDGHGNVTPTPREMSRNERDKSVTREEKRREEKEIPPNPQRGKTTPVGIKAFLDRCRTNSEKPVPDGDPVFGYAEQVGIPHDFLRLAWREFVDRHHDSEKRYRDWRKAFRNCVRSNWYKLWYVVDDGYELTTVGKQAQLKHGRDAA